MRFFLLPTIVIALISACGGGSNTSTGAGGGTSTGTMGSTSSGTDSCAGLGCASEPGPLLLAVVDGMGQPVADPTFTEQGHPLAGVCETDAGVIIADAGTCGSWVLDQLAMGPHTITVSAPGYEPASVSVMIQGPAGCCGMGPAVSSTVTLQPSPADAGTG
jgi:hypothetical protein